METEPEKPREETPAPSRGARLAWWFGIYLAGQAPLMIHMLAQSRGIFFLSLPLYFPVGLSGLFGPLDLIWQHYPTLEKIMLPIGFFFPYAFYIGHLYETLKARTRRRVDFLLLVLIVVVFINQLILTSLAGSISA